MNQSNLNLNVKEGKKPDMRMDLECKKILPFRMIVKNNSSDQSPFYKASEKVCGKNATTEKTSEMMEEIKKEVEKTCNNIAIVERTVRGAQVSIVLVSDEEIKIEEKKIETDMKK